MIDAREGRCGLSGSGSSDPTFHAIHAVSGSSLRARMLTDLGFRPVTSAPVSIPLLDASTYRDRPLIAFPNAGLQLERAGDEQAGNARFLAISPPVRFSRVLAAELSDSLVIDRWAQGSTTDVTMVPF